MEDNPKRVAKYINGLRFEIQDEMNMLSPNSMEESYRFSLKVEQKLARKNQGKILGSFRGRGLLRGRGNPIEVSISRNSK